jgi:hypothetical protein
MNVNPVTCYTKEQLLILMELVNPVKLAEASFICPHTIRKIINNKTIPERKTLKMLSMVFERQLNRVEALTGSE